MIELSPSSDIKVGELPVIIDIEHVIVVNRTYRIAVKIPHIMLIRNSGLRIQDKPDTCKNAAGRNEYDKTRRIQLMPDLKYNAGNY